MGNPSKSYAATKHRLTVEEELSKAEKERLRAAEAAKAEREAVVYANKLNDAVVREVSAIMKTAVEKLDADDVKHSLERAARGITSYEDFVGTVYQRMLDLYHGADRHGYWFLHNVLESR